jgi:hypothetical protein
MPYKLPRYYRKIDKDGKCFHLYKEDKMTDYNNISKNWFPIEIETLYIDNSLAHKAQYTDLSWTEEEITEDEAFLELL